MVNQKEFGIRLRQRRRCLGYTQVYVSEITGVSNTALCRWEHGNFMPTIDNLIILADMLKCSTDYLLMRTDKII